MTFLAGKKVVVTGAAGYLGSNICRKIKEYGADLIGIDIVSSAEPCDWMQVADVSDLDQMKEILIDCDLLFHCAAKADLDECLDKPVDTIEKNILTTAKLLLACPAKLERFVFASSVYAGSDIGGFYGASKKAAEEYVRLICESRGINYTIFRFGSIYGPGSSINNGLHKIVESALKNGVVDYSGALSKERQYIYIEDAADWAIEALDDSTLDKIVILSGVESTKITSLLELVAETLGLSAVHLVGDTDGAPGHYVKSPYRLYNEITPKKYIPRQTTELSLGIKNLAMYILESQGIGM